VAVVHPDLPYISGSAEVDADFFDLELTPPVSPPLFALPRMPVSRAEYALGMHASALVADGGCVQIGIGALSDALVSGLLLRQRDNILWRRALLALDAGGETHALARWLGGLAPFVTGLHGVSEMVLDGFMHLQRAGILKRRSWDNLALERAAANSRLADDVPGGHYLRGAFFPRHAGVVSLAGRDRSYRSRRHRHGTDIRGQSRGWRPSCAGDPAASRRALLQHLHDGHLARRDGVGHAGRRRRGQRHRRPA
jgi:hypothetical protein